MSVVACVKQIDYIIVLYISGAKEGDVMFTPKFGLSNLTVKSEGGGLQRVHCIYIPNPQLSHSTISLGLSEPSV
jgi:hypothetical protein